MPQPAIWLEVASGRPERKAYTPSGSGDGSCPDGGLMNGEGRGWSPIVSIADLGPYSPVRRGPAEITAPSW
jgi:hypothetical protein